MHKDILLSTVQFILLVLLQVFLLDNISLFGYVNPMVYIWFIILLPCSTPKWLELISCFALGLCIDFFSGDIGIHALSCTLLGFVRPWFVGIFANNTDSNNYRPSIPSFGFFNFLGFVGVLTLIHHLICFLVSTFVWVELLQILFRTLISSIVTIVIIILLDLIFTKKK